MKKTKKSKTRKTKLLNKAFFKNIWSKFVHAPRIVNVFLSILSFAIIFLFLSGSHFSGTYHYEVGSLVKEDIFLTKDVIDYATTAKIKEETKQKVQPIMYLDFSKLVNSKRELNDFFARLYEVKESYKDDLQLMKKIYAGIERKNIYGLKEDQLLELAALPKNRLTNILNYAIDITSQKMISGITQSQINESYASIDAYVDDLDITATDKSLLKVFIKGSIKENLFVDKEKTDAKIAEELERIEPVKLKSGTLLISSGQKIDEKVFSILKEGDMLFVSSNDYWVSLLKVFLLQLLYWIILHVFLIGFSRDVLSSPKKYGMLMSLFVLVFTTSTFFMGFSVYSLPIASFVMLIAMLINMSVAIGAGLTMVFLLQAHLELNASLMIAYSLVVIVCSVLSRQVKQRTQIITTGFTASLMLLWSTYCLLFIQRSSDLLTSNDVLFMFLSGPLSSILTIGIMPFYEIFFAALTPFKLLELSNPNKPLLKRLLIEAPGTYHHSILVGNLAETAAHDIKANSLLTRVAAFYHDVGKLDRPFYFKENQISDENPHDKLPPQVSANIIREHMIHGVQLCEKNKLPKEIVDVIKAHHGTSLIKYFYFQEQKNNPDVDVSKFVYPGPKPRSKESVILMLADSVEAAVRTLESPTKASLQELIDKITQGKIEEKQFTDSDMSFKELEKVKKSFINVLSGIFHERIVYPEIDIKNVQKDVFDESED